MKSRSTLIFTCIVFTLLASMCIFFPSDGIRIGGITLRFPSLHKVLVHEKTTSLDDLLHEAEAEELAGMCDSVAYYRQLCDSSDIRFWFPNDDPSFFDPLFAQMESAQKQGRIVRILHYGDSQIEMDRMSDRLRAYVQEEYGGGGPGMLPILQPVASRTVNQYASGALFPQASYGDSLAPRANGNYGPMARCWHVGGGASAGFNASRQKNVPESFKHFSTVTLIFNNRPGPLSATLSNRKSAYSRQQQCADVGVHSFTWQLDSSCDALRLSLQGNADIYGVLVDNGPGVAVDNIPLRGCSGQQFTMINADQLAAAYEQMNVGLIIMQFGGNSMSYLTNQRALEGYATTLGHQIDYLHKLCPNALILFIGPSDMSTSVNGELQSYPYLSSVVEGLRRMANEHGAAYWSIYDAMGGHNSMRTWADNGLAGSDYIHFSQKGVDMIGDRLVQSFQRMAELYHFRKRIPKTTFDSIWKHPYTAPSQPTVANTRH